MVLETVSSCQTGAPKGLEIFSSFIIYK
jgi:hypothetical protein